MARKPLRVPETQEYLHAFMLLRSKTKALRLVEMHPAANWKEITILAKQYLEQEAAQKALLKTPEQTALLSKAGLTRQDWQDFFFQSRNLAMIGLPHKSTNELQVTRSIPVHAHAVGTVTLSAMGHKSHGIGLPYGMTDRGVISVCTTMAVRNNSRIIEIDYIMDIFRLLMDSPGSAAKKRSQIGGSQYRQLNESIRRLAFCGMLMDLGDGGTSWSDIRPLLGAAKLPSYQLETKFQAGEELLLPDAFPLTTSPKNFRIALDEKLYEVITTSAIPYPVDYLKEFTDEPLLWDLAHFLPARLQAAKSTSAIPLMSLDGRGVGLKEQLGSEDNNFYRFRSRLEEGIGRIKGLWKHCNAEIQGYNLIVHPITPAQWLVPPKDESRYNIGRELSKHELYQADQDLSDIPSDTINT